MIDYNICAPKITVYWQNSSQKRNIRLPALAGCRLVWSAAGSANAFLCAGSNSDFPATCGVGAGLPVVHFFILWGSLIPHTRCRLYGVVHSICKQSGLYCTIRPLLVGSKCPSKFVIRFVALHAPQCSEWFVEIRETREQKLLCVSVNSQPIGRDNSDRKPPQSPVIAIISRS